MIKQLANASIWSENLNNLLPFYRDVLGLNVAMDSPEYVYLAPDEQSPGLGLATHSEVHGRNTDPARHMVAFLSDDLPADWKRLKDAGVEFIQDPTDYGDGMSIATLKDPEGNYVQLFSMQSQPAS